MLNNLAALVKKFPLDRVIALIFYSSAVKGFDYPQDLDVALITKNAIPEGFYAKLVDGNSWRCDDDLVKPALKGSVRLIFDPGLQRPIDVWVEPVNEFLKALQGNNNHYHTAVSMQGSVEDNCLTPHKIAKLIAEGVVIFYTQPPKQSLGVEMLVDQRWHGEMMGLILR